ncbi:MAG: hypothetical protein IME93_03075 [Proteobacteria bacterium]|nr:hypothetical protein [Pseudomonadota bacterium]
MNQAKPVTIEGRTYPHLKAACKAFGIKYYGVYSRVRAHGGSARKVLLDKIAEKKYIKGDIAPSEHPAVSRFLYGI